MNVEGLWGMYLWAAAVALAIVAGAVAATTRRDPRPWLAPEHVAGAALVGLFGWEMLVTLPGSVMGYWSLTAGMGDVDGVEAQQAYVVAQAAFVIGAAFAVAGILRRRTWGAVLGIGLAAAIVVSSVVQFVHITTTVAESMSSDAYLSIMAAMIGGRAIPALAAVALLLWPLMRGRMRRADASGHATA